MIFEFVHLIGIIVLLDIILLAYVGLSLVKNGSSIKLGKIVAAFIIIAFILVTVVGIVCGFLPSQNELFIKFSTIMVVSGGLVSIWNILAD